MDNQQHMEQGKTCNCPHHSVVPLLIALIGADLLLGATNVLTVAFVSVSWPILLILIGLMKMTGRKCKCCSM